MSNSATVNVNGGQILVSPQQLDGGPTASSISWTMAARGHQFTGIQGANGVSWKCAIGANGTTMSCKTADIPTGSKVNYVLLVSPAPTGPEPDIWIVND